MASRLISVVIPAHITSVESLRLLDGQLDAVAGQDYSGQFEVLVVDNGSPVRVREHIARHPLATRLSLRCLDAAQRRGAAYARNCGAEAASGEILLFCDHDDVVHSDWLSSLVEFLDTGYDLVGSAVEEHSLNRDNPRTMVEVPAPESFQPPGVRVPVVVSSSMACRADMYRAVGGMDETYSANEDVEFGWRADRQGYSVGYLPAALVGYRHRRGFRPALRQGWARGIGLARLHAEYPGNGLPEARLSTTVRDLVALAVARRATRAERGLMLGVLVGQLLGGRFTTVRANGR